MLDMRVGRSDWITAVRFKSVPTFEDLTTAVDIIAERYDYRTRLWNFGDVGFDLSMDHIKAIADYSKQRFTEPNIVACVAPDDLAFGLLRAYEVYRQQPGISTARVFRTNKEALRWLREMRERSAP